MGEARARDGAAVRTAVKQAHATIVAAARMEGARPKRRAIARRYYCSGVGARILEINKD